MLLLACTMYSCSFLKKGGEEAGKYIPIKIEEDSKIRFSDVFDQVDYIPLETADSSLIGIVERFRIFDHKLCLLCDKSFLQFDAYTGHMISKISKFGNAPGEYQSLYDVSVSKEGDIELLDMTGRKICRYDIDGTFKSSLDLPSMSFSFLANGENDYWLYNNNMPFEDIKSKVVHYDASAGVMKEQYFPIDEELANYFFVVEGNNFVKRKNDVLFFSCPSERIYSLKEGMEPTVEYIIDWGKHALPSDFCSGNYSDIVEFSTEADKRGYVYFVNNISANDAYIQISFFLNKVAYWSIYSEPIGMSYTGCILQDDLNALREFPINAMNTFYALDENYLYFLLSAEQFVEICGKDNSLFDLISKSNISDQSNPLLVRCRFKGSL